MEKLSKESLNYITPIYHRYLVEKERDNSLDITNPLHVFNLARWIGYDWKISHAEKFINHLEEIKEHYASIQKHYQEYLDAFIPVYSDVEMPDGSIENIQTEFPLDYYQFRKKYYKPY